MIIKNTKIYSSRKTYPEDQEGVRPIISFSVEDLLSLYFINEQPRLAC